MKHPFLVCSSKIVFISNTPKTAPVRRYIGETGMPELKIISTIMAAPNLIELIKKPRVGECYVIRFLSDGMIRWPNN